jgi:hypothetical protein
LLFSGDFERTHGKGVLKPAQIELDKHPDANLINCNELGIVSHGTRPD